MRKFVLSVAAVGAAVIAATPAAAQYYPGQPAPYGNAYGYQNNWGQVRSLQVRLNNIERQINRLDHRDRLGDRSADRLRDEANRIERKLRDRMRGGLDYRELRDIEVRTARLEQRVQFAMNDRGRLGYNDRDDRWDRRD
jgi:hypothetical protein